MRVKKIFKLSLSILFVLMFAFVFAVQPVASKDLVVSLAQLPGLSDSPDKGALVDLVKAMDEVYTDGTIKIEVFPFARSISNVLEGRADFHLPQFDNPYLPVSKRQYALTRESLGTGIFILYSHVDKSISKKMIEDAVARGGAFPFKIECSRGMAASLNFPLAGSDSIEQSFKKLASKRIDAIIRGQEEADLVLKKLKLKSIVRARMYDFNEKVLIKKGPDGEQIDKIISEIIVKLRNSGKLQQLYLKVHRPYEDWQPSKMGW